MRVKASNCFMSIPTSGPIISWTSPPEQKLPPFGRKGDSVDVVGINEIAKSVAQFSIRIEGQRILRSGLLSLIAATAPSTRHRKCEGLKPCIDVMLRPPSRSGTISALRTSARHSRRNEMPLKSSSIQRSLAAAIAAKAARPRRVSVINEVRRSPLRRERATKPSATRPIDDAGDIAVRHNQKPRYLAHQHAVGLAVQRRHHVETRQGRIELPLQPFADHALDKAAGAQKPRIHSRSRALRSIVLPFSL